MNKNTYETVKLTKGEMHVYDFGAVRLHAYQTHDPIDDEVFLVEKAGQVVVLESPCFHDNIAELTAYLRDRKLEPAGMLAAYHGAGAAFLPGVPKYATQSAVDYSAQGGGKALIDGFAAAFGAAFDPSIHRADHILAEGPVIIGGIRFVIHPTAEAFDVEIPEINAVYTHNMRCCCLPVDEGGLSLDALDRSGAAVCYVTPSHQFPTGVTMPAGRRAELLHWAARRPGQRYIIEDDYDSEFRLIGRAHV